MSNARQSPVRGVSEAEVRVQGSSLSISARFGGIARMRSVLILFLAGLELFFLIVSGILFLYFMESNPALLLIPVAALAPWIVLLPVMVRILRRKTTVALDVLLNNMATLSE